MSSLNGKFHFGPERGNFPGKGCVVLMIIPPFSFICVRLSQISRSKLQDAMEIYRSIVWSDMLRSAKSTENLSSGFKINRAADDAAELTISEKMRKQMRGLDRASTNIDRISKQRSAGRHLFIPDKRVSQNHQMRWLSDTLALYIEKSGKNPLICGSFPDFLRTLIKLLIL